MVKEKDGYRTKFQELLRELFQLESAKDLDFGIYRILNYKRDVVERFIEKDLLDAVEAELARGALADQAGAARELEALANKVRSDLGDAALDAKGILADAYQDTPLGRKYLQLFELARGAKPRPEVEVAIFNHLWSFFRHYYDAGDFLTKKRYSKRQKYAIPYNGEEVYLHWANRDQYYVKTTEHFTDYTFRAPGGVAVHFKLRAADVEKDNVKGDKRFFVPVVGDATFDANAAEVVIPFEYRALTEQEEITYGKKEKAQETLNNDASAALLKKFANAPVAIGALSAEKKRTEKGDAISFFDYYLRIYTARNTSDYFIHKDLKGFLERELDFYLKNEVLNVDELETGGEARADAWFQQMRVIKGVGRKVIGFLSQIEELQKQLYEKRKFVLRADYVLALRTLEGVLTTDAFSRFVDFNTRAINSNREYKIGLSRVIEETYKRPAYNVYVASIRWEKTRIRLTYSKRFTDEGKLRNFIEKNPGASYSETEEIIRGKNKVCYYVPYEPADLPTELSYGALLIDTKFIPAEVKDELIGEVAAAVPLDDLCNGLVICGENFQAMALVSERFSGNIRCAYLDPPYNTGNDEFLYKDDYQHSSWMTMMYDRVRLVRNLLRKDGTVYTSIDWNETHRLRALLALGEVMGEGNFQREIIWNTGENISGFKSLAPNWIRQHDTVLFFSASPTEAVFYKLWEPLDPAAKPGWLDIIGPEKDSLYIEQWEDGSVTRVPIREISVKPLGDVWNDILSFQYSEPRVTESWFFATQKVENLVRRIIQAATVPGDYVLDPFLGTGTTAAVAHKIGRKWLGIEMSDCFDRKVLPRLKTVLIGENRSHLSADFHWPGGGCFKYIYLESYDDALNNIAFDEDAAQSAMAFDDYAIKYMLSWETKESATFLNAAQLEDPFNYKLVVVEDGVTVEKPVDLTETFNYLLGLHVATRRVYYDDDRKYLVYRGKTRDGGAVAVIWRKTKGWTQADYERDRGFVAGEKMTEGADEVFVNGDSAVPGARSLDPVFKERMFAPVGEGGGV